MQRQGRNKTRVIIGITGSFSSGKTTVAKMFASSGGKLLDADKIAHTIIKRGHTAYKRIVTVFGKDILDKNRQINRSKLAWLVFNNKKSLMKLNNIVHPQVMGIIKKEIACSKPRFVILDLPLLFEAGLKKFVDKIIVVNITRDKQIQRAKVRTFLSRMDILRRIKLQIPLKAKLRFADFIIDNSGTIKETRKQVTRVFQELFGKKEKPEAKRK